MVSGVTGYIDHNIDAIVADALGDGLVGLSLDGAPMIGAFLQTCRPRVVVIAVVITKYFMSCFIMLGQRGCVAGDLRKN
jgi:hypothetical protein